METVTQCPVCGDSSSSPFLVCKDHLVSHRNFFIVKCNACSFRFTNPRPDEGEISTYYNSKQYISHNDSSNGIIGTVYRLVRGYALQSKLKLINRLNGGAGRVLDVGCGTGAFLETCKASGWNIAGIEPDPTARAATMKRLQIDVPPSLDRLSRAELFDVITLWHVLEHVHNLDQTVRQLKKLLSEEGALLIAVPNSDSYDATYFKENWAAYDIPRHLYHFTPSTIESIFRKHGFRLVEQRPMLFDAFYIALLSTRYKTGKTDYLKSVRVGLASNAKAQQTGNFSSIIYLLEKIK